MFKLVNGGEKLPLRATRYSSGFDVYSREDKVIGAGCTELIGLGIAIDEEVYKNWYTNWDEVNSFKSRYFFELHIADGLAQKGLIASPKIINIDYPDEIKMVVHNPMTSFIISAEGNITKIGAHGYEHIESYTINKGDKIGQLLLKRHEGYLLPQEYTLDNERVGGFGSSGV